MFLHEMIIKACNFAVQSYFSKTYNVPFYLSLFMLRSLNILVTFCCIFRFVVGFLNPVYYRFSLFFSDKLCRSKCSVSDNENSVLIIIFYSFCDAYFLSDNKQNKSKGHF